MNCYQLPADEERTSYMIAYYYRLLQLTLLLILFFSTMAAHSVNLVANYFYDGDMSSQSWSSPAIDVDLDGTVALAINRRIGAGNARAIGAEATLILLYDAKGEAIGQFTDYPATMVDITFGPDHRIYTAEGWFATGMHIFDRPGMVNRFVQCVFLRLMVVKQTKAVLNR